MSDHLPECREALIPDFENQRWMCICNHLRAREQRVLDAAREAVLAYADSTHKHVGVYACLPDKGDRCNITAALRVAAQRIDALRGES